MLYRLLQNAAHADPLTYRQLVANPKPKAVKPEGLAGPRSRPGTLALPPQDRPRIAPGGLSRTSADKFRSADRILAAKWITSYPRSPVLWDPLAGNGILAQAVTGVGAEPTPASLRRHARDPSPGRYIPLWPLCPGNGSGRSGVSRLQGREPATARSEARECSPGAAEPRPGDSRGVRGRP